MLFQAEKMKQHAPCKDISMWPTHHTQPTQPAPSVLEGWPTEEMTTAFADVFNVRDQSGTFTPAFRAALAAAPEAKP